MTKSIVITRASKGIGRAAADALAEQGWTVIGVARALARHRYKIDTTAVAVNSGCAAENEDVAGERLLVYPCQKWCLVFPIVQEPSC